MSENQVIIGILALLTIAVALVAVEIVRLNDSLQPVVNSTLFRAATSF